MSFWSNVKGRIAAWAIDTSYTELLHERDLWKEHAKRVERQLELYVSQEVRLRR